MKILDANELYQRLIEAGNDWADKQAAFNVLDDTKNSVLAKLTLKSDATSVSAREVDAKASQEYTDHVKATQNAFKEALKAKVKWESIRIWIDLRRSEEATRRAELML